jgi:hypothetical protein
MELKPRSAYLLRGPARRDWQHSIPPVDELRYSITFRSLRQETYNALDSFNGPSAADTQTSRNVVCPFQTRAPISEEEL